MKRKQIVKIFIANCFFLVLFCAALSADSFNLNTQNSTIRFINRSGKKTELKITPSSLSSPPPHYSSSRSNHYDSLIREASNRFGVGFELIKAVIHAESAFNPYAESHKGARGLMQLMPETARGLGVGNSFNPRDNVLGGTRYLRNMLERYNHDLKLSLAAYNAGPGAVDRNGGIPPYPETRNFIYRVINLMRSYGRVQSSGKIYQVVKNGRVLITNRPLP